MPLLVALVYVSGICGAILTALFVVSHNFEGSDRFPEQKPGEDEVNGFESPNV